MPGNQSDGVARQLEYYARTAAGYDEHHDDELKLPLEIVMDCLQRWGARSVLDVGTGTGRLVRELHARHPDMHVHGVDPVPELLAVGRERFGVPPESLSVAAGQELPFADGSWDAVCELSVLHHVPDPDMVVDEMLRVAARMVIISDDNRFGVGSLPRKVAKSALDRVGLLDAVVRVRQGGDAYRVSSGDGISYGFSVYDVIDRVREWADEVNVHPVGGPESGPLARRHRIGAPGIVLCARRRR